MEDTYYGEVAVDIRHCGKSTYQSEVEVEDREMAVDEDASWRQP